MGSGDPPIYPQPFEVAAERNGALLFLRLSGELDLGSTEALKEAVRAASDSQALESIAIDLRDLSFIDSSGLRALVEIQDALVDKGLRMTVVRPRESIGKVLEVTGIGARLSMVDDPSEL